MPKRGGLSRPINAGIRRTGPMFHQPDWAHLREVRGLAQVTFWIERAWREHIG